MVVSDFFENRACKTDAQAPLSWQVQIVPDINFLFERAEGANGVEIAKQNNTVGYGSQNTFFVPNLGVALPTSNTAFTDNGQIFGQTPTSSDSLTTLLDYVDLEVSNFVLPDCSNGECVAGYKFSGTVTVKNLSAVPFDGNLGVGLSLKIGMVDESFPIQAQVVAIAEQGGTADLTFDWMLDNPAFHGNAKAKVEINPIENGQHPITEKDGNGNDAYGNNLLPANQSPSFQIKYVDLRVTKIETKDGNGNAASAYKNTDTIPATVTIQNFGDHAATLSGATFSAKVMKANVEAGSSQSGNMPDLNFSEAGFPNEKQTFSILMPVVATGGKNFSINVKLGNVDFDDDVADPTESNKPDEKTDGSFRVDAQPSITSVTRTGNEVVSPLDQITFSGVCVDAEGDAVDVSWSQDVPDGANSTRCSSFQTPNSPSTLCEIIANPGSTYKYFNVTFTCDDTNDLWPVTTLTIQVKTSN